MTLLPSWSSVSIRLRTSIADSSWAVPSVASRSSRALMIPWTARRARRRAMNATTTISTMWKPSLRSQATISFQGGFVKSGIGS